MTKAHRASVVRMVSKEILESLLRNLRLLGAFVRSRTVQLFRWMSKSFVENGQHFDSAPPISSLTTIA